MSKKKVYVMYAPGGNGHRSGAKMIKETFARKYPDHEIIIEDAVVFGNIFLKFCLDIYDNILKVDPKYVKYAFGLVNSLNSDKNLVQLFPKVTNAISKRLAEVNPDIVVSVHSGINNFIIEAMKTNGTYNKVPFVIVCTDLTDNFLSSWVNNDANLTIGFLEESKDQMIEYGLAPEKIKVLGGPPVNPLFSDNSLTKNEARRKFGLDNDKFTVLIMSGGIGLKNNYKFAKQLINSSLPLQLIVCCGKNEKLKTQVEKMIKYSKKNVKVFGFTNEVHNLMDAADIIVTKPGPGVIAEAIVKELPIVLDNLSEIMPQEAGNVEYIIKNGVGIKISELSNFHNHIATFIYNDELLPKMKGNMKRLRKTESSSKLIEMLVSIMNQGITEKLYTKDFENDLVF